jgi:hypothetical protein
MREMKISEDSTSKLKERVVIVMEGNEYHLQDGLLYKLDKLCIPRVVGNFGVTKIVENLTMVCVLAKDAGAGGKVC